MKIKNIIITFTLLLGLTMVSCESSFDFNKEQYKKVVYIMGGDNSFKIFDRTVLDLAQDKDTLYLTVGVGGTTEPDKDITVTIEDADSLFNAYNKSNFDIKTEKFAKILSPDFYTIASKTVVIKKGTSTTRIPVVLKNLDKLSPDTTYFLDYKIKSISNYELSKENKEALYRIYYKNRWSTTKKTPNYNAIAFSLGLNSNPGNDTILISASPKVFPLTKNSVRATVGKYPFEKLEDINAYSFVVEVADDVLSKTQYEEVRKVQIKKYKEMSVTQLDPTDPANTFNNTFVDLKKQVAPGVFIHLKIFNLETRIMEERLKLQYIPQEEM